MGQQVEMQITENMHSIGLKHFDSFLTNIKMDREYRKNKKPEKTNEVQSVIFCV